ncbi:glycosyltransferase [Acetivibrio cellulolyticus]|uniref:glycosyltransferase n=1 Tax=Acetivibrio cellulolyticus TaxID=35830 RepID=UPI0001E2EC17|nr:glycosyltransferase [Acetivibrio cellulolyticus]
MESKIMVSIIVAIYNHEKYLEKALNSIIMQEVNFDYEVLIGEDCSTDNSRTKLKNLELSLPGNFQLFYRENNLGAVANFKDLYSRMRGKYYIVLEGDDYWIYKGKLQEQVDFLENNVDYIAIAHNVKIIDEDGADSNKKYPECKKQEYTLKEYRKGLFPGQTASILIRNYFLDHSINYIVEGISSPEDKIKAFVLSTNGKIRCIQSVWSAYRLVVNSGSSHSAITKNAFNINTEVLFYKSLYDYAKKANVSNESIIISSQMYALRLMRSLIRKDGNIKFNGFLERFSQFDNKVIIILYLVTICIKYPYIKTMYLIRKKRNKYL